MAKLCCKKGSNDILVLHLHLTFHNIFLNPEEVVLLSYFCLLKFFLKIDGKFAVIIEKYYKESRSYFGKNLKKFGKNFIEIINNVVKIKEILEKYLDL